MRYRKLRDEAFTACGGTPQLLAHVRDFLCDDGESVSNNGFLHGEGDADAFLAVAPVGVVTAEEEMFSGDDEDFAGFEALIEFGRCNGEIRKPEPQKQPVEPSRRPCHLARRGEFKTI